MRAHATVRLWTMIVVATVALTGCGVTQPTTSPPTASGSSEPSAAFGITPAPSLEPSPSTATAATPTPEPTPRPTLKPPMVEVTLRNPGGNQAAAGITSGDYVTVTLKLTVRHVNRATCVLRHQITPDKPGVAPSTVRLKPLESQSVKLIDGRHHFEVRCPVSKDLIPSGEVTSVVNRIAVDGLPERCTGFDFEESGITATTIDELTAGVVGRWSGCVSTPWATPLYHVDLEMRADGTYSASSPEELDGQAMQALYFGTDDDSPYKTYAINDFQASKKGVGQIDLVFAVGQPGTRGELRNIRLMGDKLEFEVFYGGSGPITLQLTREGTAG